MRSEDVRALLQAGQPLTREPGMTDDFLLAEIASAGAIFLLGW
ncbi:hypothetical protein SAMN02745121_06124 [Nannocystis exedens]|uniref:Uncharacterized protein n=1 Tax=Nannocystis exedens TaxID=54 RepID=A0A1I2ELM8_9BACT|nr:hypothetical protein [Nannocystis exedens]PCC73956.1 hypothetical protein NAEX_07045 [Nannocystis exedens]SFE93689.1 hypothetical protein SAMN02745121_06124 [Nannocystis exedens]